MQKQTIILAALLAATAAHADTQPQTYVTVAAGSSHINIACDGAPTCDKSDTGGKLVVGYDFGNNFSLEGGYISFGKGRFGIPTDTVTIKANAFLLGGAYTLPLNSEWGMNFRLGVAQVKTKGEEVTATARLSSSESKAKVYAGLGVSYAVSKAVKLELGLDTTQGQLEGEKGNLRLISLGATFAF